MHRGVVAAVFAVLTAACAARSTGMRQFDAVVRQGQWLAARENADESLAARLDEHVKRQAQSVEFNPKKYFYAKAYVEYHLKKRYGRAIEAMQQVLVFSLANKEILRFMDLARVLADEQAATSKRQVAQKPPPRPPAPAISPAAPAAPEPISIPVDPEGMENRYSEALKAYIGGDLAQARGIIKELVDAEPANARWKEALARVEKELAHVKPH